MSVQPNGIITPGGNGTSAEIHPGSQPGRRLDSGGANLTSESMRTEVMGVDHSATTTENASSVARREGGTIGTPRKKEENDLEGGEQTAFGRSSLLNRTPPAGGRAISLDRPEESKRPEENLLETCKPKRKEDEECPGEEPSGIQSRPSKKRKAQFSPRTTKDVDKERKLLWGRMTKKIEELRSIVKTNPKIRTDIKRCSEGLQSLMVVLNQLEEDSTQSIGQNTERKDKNFTTNVEGEGSLVQIETNSGNTLQRSEDKETIDVNTVEKHSEDKWDQYHSRTKTRRLKKQFQDGAEKSRKSNPDDQKNRQENRPQNKQNLKTRETGDQPSKTSQKNFLGKYRPDAILVRPKEGKTFSEVLRAMKEETTPEECEAKVKMVRKTRNGEILVELDKQTKNQEKFSETLKKALGEDAIVLTLSRKISLEIRDMDDMTTTEDVMQAVGKALKIEDAHLDMQISLRGPNNRGLKLAIVELKEQHARDLLKIERVKIGWVNCRIRRRPIVLRCYRCLGYGHIARNCKNAEKKNLCFKCGKEGHISKNCVNNPQCTICREAKLEEDQLGHIMGSATCATFRKALDEAKLALKR